MSERFIPLKPELQMAKDDILYYDSHAPFENIKSAIIARQSIACNLVATISDLGRKSKNFETSLKNTGDAVTLLMNDVMSMIPCGTVKLIVRV